MRAQVEILADVVKAIAQGDLPDAAIDQAKACLLYGLTMAAGGYTPDDPVLSSMLAMGNPAGGARILVTGERRPVGDAAAINAALYCARGQNDSSASLAGHVGCIVLPALMAVAEQSGTSGAQLLRGILAGYEVMLMLAQNSAPAVRARGFRTTAVYGPIGIAAGLGAMLDLDAKTIANALALAADAGSGLLQCWADGSLEWRFQAYRAAHGGVQAILAARHGVRGARLAIEGPTGFLAAFAGGAPALACDIRWRISEVEFKPFPGCYLNQPASRALHAVLLEQGIPADHILSIVVRMHPDDARYPGVALHGPFDDPTAAIMSAPFLLAVLLTDGFPRRHHFETWFGAHPVHIRSRSIEVMPDPTVARLSPILELHMRDGGTLHRKCERAANTNPGLDATAIQIRAVAAEWPWHDGTARFDVMLQRIRMLEGASAVNCQSSLMP